MSYPHASTYGNYYASAARDNPTFPGAYDHGKPTHVNDTYPTRQPQSDGVRQPQYDSASYDWASQSQPSYTENNRPPYFSAMWQNVKAPQPLHEERRLVDGQSTQSTTANSPPPYYPSGNLDAPAPNTQEPNSLAYVSGLDTSRTTGAGHQPRQPSLPAASQYSIPYITNAPGRSQSPAGQPQVRYGPQQSTPRPSQSQPSPAANPKSGMTSPATALANAVSRRDPSSTVSGGRPSASPRLTGASDAHGHPAARPSSPYVPRHHDPSQSNRAVMSPSSNRSNFGEYDMTSRTSSSSSMQIHEQALQQINSISNLVSHANDDIGQPGHANTMESAGVIPSYVDPTKVFNQFYREHERRRNEAETEPKKQAGEEQAAARRRKEDEAAALASRAIAVSTPKGSEPRQVDQRNGSPTHDVIVGAAASIAKADRSPEAKKVSKKAASTRSASKSPVKSMPSPNAIVADAHQPPPGQPGEIEMADELKMMMEKMRQFRNKDPMLFQKLWDDLRKSSQSSGVGVPAVSTQSPHPRASQEPQIPETVTDLAQKPFRPSLNGLDHASALAPTKGPPPGPGPAQAVSTSTPSPPPPPSQPAPPASQPSNTASSVLTLPPLNGYRTVVENNLEGLPDLGRFPAERRIRASYAKKDTKRALVTVEQSVNVASAPTVEEAIAPPPAVPEPPRLPQPQPLVAAVKSPPAPAGAASPPLTRELLSHGTTGGTVWPEEKRKPVAEAALTALKSYPENRGIEVNGADIYAMLEENPSYIDLCKLLEAKGLRFSRGHFARQLLSNVPHLNGPYSTGAQIPAAQSEAPAQHLQQVTHAATTVPPPPLAGLSTPNIPSSLPERLVSPNPRPQGQLPPDLGPVAILPPAQGATGTTQPVKTEGPLPRVYQIPNSVKSIKNRVLPMRTEPPPGSKEAQARKRDFSELVDLTALSDNDDYVTSRKQPRIESRSPEPDPFQVYQNPIRMANQPVPHSQPVQNGQLTAYGSGFQPGTPLRFDPNMAQARLFLPTGAPPGHQMQAASSTVPRTEASIILAKPVDIGEALRNHYYNTKTVARDVLIAAGIHPTERMLNAHMAGLLGKQISIDSDLATFDWDAVDPGGPPPPRVQLVEVPAEPPCHGQAQEPRRSEARDHTPDAQLPNSDKRVSPAPAPLTSRSAVSQCDKHSNLRGASEAVRGESRMRESPASKTANAQSPTSTKREGQPKVVTVPKGTPDATRTRSSSAQLRQSTEPEEMSGAFFPSGKRRGRPPGSKNIVRGTASPPADVRMKPTPVTVASATEPSPPAPSHPLFRCRWKGCRAHLHNLATLQQHISTVHRPSSTDVETSGYICWWRKCPLLKTDDEQQVFPEKSFANLDEWLAHIQDLHMFEVGMKHGDGPSTKHIDPQTILQDRTRYLSDEHGRVTTQYYSTRSTNDWQPDTMTLLSAEPDKTEASAQKSFMKTHRHKRTKIGEDKAIAVETLRAMEARKAKIGPGVDRGGCILVTEERRATLVQNQDLARVVDVNY